MGIFNDRKEQKRFVKFAMVGTIGMLVDFVVFNIAKPILETIPSLLAEVSPEVTQASLLAQGFSFVAAVTSNFVLNRNWTFKDSRSKRLRVQITQYLIVNTMGLIIRTPIFAVLGGLFHAYLDTLQLPFGVNAVWLAHNLALAGAIGVVLLWNYFVNRKWTFGDVS